VQVTVQDGVGSEAQHVRDRVAVGHGRAGEHVVHTVRRCGPGHRHGEVAERCGERRGAVPEAPPDVLVARLAIGEVPAQHRVGRRPERRGALHALVVGTRSLGAEDTADAGLDHQAGRGHGRVPDVVDHERRGDGDQGAALRVPEHGEELPLRERRHQFGPHELERGAEGQGAGESQRLERLVLLGTERAEQSQDVGFEVPVPERGPHHRPGPVVLGDQPGSAAGVDQRVDQARHSPGLRVEPCGQSGVGVDAAVASEVVRGLGVQQGPQVHGRGASGGTRHRRPGAPGQRRRRDDHRGTQPRREGVDQEHRRVVEVVRVVDEQHHAALQLLREAVGERDDVDVRVRGRRPGTTLSRPVPVEAVRRDGLDAGRFEVGGGASEQFAPTGARQPADDDAVAPSDRVQHLGEFRCTCVHISVPDRCAEGELRRRYRPTRPRRTACPARRAHAYPRPASKDRRRRSS
jgi:hypothetical protein